MPRKDFFHDAVKNALVKDGWTITADPLRIEFGGMDFYIDLGAERLIEAEKDGRKIAVEIKGFASPSVVYEFHAAIGQFMNYRLALSQEEPEREMYLAVPEDIFDSFFEMPFGLLAITEYQLRLLVYDEEKEVIIKWIE
jgi:hypothetical protein